MTRRVMRCTQEVDEMGALEEFTSDVTYVANVSDVSHLTGHGLARVGTLVHPGMVLVGKVGQRKTEGLHSMTEIEQLTATEEELRRYWQRRAYDGSMYAPEGCIGRVVGAYFESNGVPRPFRDYEKPTGVAVVEIETP